MQRNKKGQFVKGHKLIPYKNPIPRFTIACLWCGKKKEVIRCQKDTRKFCNTECYAKTLHFEHLVLEALGISKKKGRFVECDYCHKEFYIREGKSSIHNFHSPQCYHKWQIGKAPLTHFKKGHLSPMKGKTFVEVFGEEKAFKIISNWRKKFVALWQTKDFREKMLSRDMTPFREGLEKWRKENPEKVREFVLKAGQVQRQNKLNKLMEFAGVHNGS